MMARVTRWVSDHHVHRRASELVKFLLIIALLEVAAGAGLSYVAGFSAIHRVAETFNWRFLGLALGALAPSCAGYYYAYSGIYRFEQGPCLSRRQLLAVVVAGFGGFIAHSGSALDNYALRAAGFDKRESTVRTSALSGLEQGILSIAGCAASIVVLVRGLPHPPPGMTLPWAICPVPGFVLAFALASRYRDRLRGKRGWRHHLGVFLDSIYLIRGLFCSPRRSAAPLLGMALFWVAEVLVLWASLAAFGYHASEPALIVGYSTGMLFTRRTGPFGGAGVLMLILPFTLTASGVPFATAVLGVFTYRIVTIWPPVPCALAFLGTLRRLAEPPASHRLEATKSVPASSAVSPS
jgi:uncharacterized membrane protein YbhN (UPF0104 family)